MMQASARTIGLTAVAMLAFAANSLLCRLALKSTVIDAASFTLIRLAAGALALFLLARRKAGAKADAGDWRSALALASYASCFSWAYVGLSAGTGALLLFGSVQLTMIGSGLWRGERLSRWQTAGLCLAFIGLLALLLPGAHAPPWDKGALMLASGVSWGVYSLRGRAARNPLAATAGNFWRAGVLTLCITPAFAMNLSIDAPGALFAVASGAVASGIGYSIWYAAIRGLSATGAASVQLCVPVLAASGAVVWLGEPLTARLAITSVVILGGVAIVIVQRRIGGARRSKP